VYHEHLAGAELKKFIEDPKSVKEAYFSIEHPYSVSKHNSIGKLKITSYTETNGVVKDVTTLLIEEKWDPGYDIIKLSPVYEDAIENKGTVYIDKHGNSEKVNDQVDISLLNAGLVHYPRSAITDLDTTAKRKSQ
jgi:hypothetical protein